MTDIKETFHHNYYLLFAIHHNITDGFSTIHICNFLIKILNMVIEKDNIDETQLGYFDDGSQIDELIKVKELELKSDSVLLHEIKKLQNKKESSKILLHDVIKCDKNFIPRTMNISKDLTKADTNDLIQRFKSMGVTFHSGFTILVCTAIVEFLNNKGVQNPSYEIGLTNAVNSRRFYKNQNCIPLGNHMIGLGMCLDIPRNVREDFKNYAKEFHASMKERMESGKIFCDTGLTSVIADEGKKDTVSYEDEIKKLDNLILSEYFHISNMGDITSHLGDEGKHVQTA